MVAASPGLAQQRIEKEQLPAQVQQALRTSGTGEVKEITRRSENGRTVYEIERTNRLTIAEDGTLLERSHGSGDRAGQSGRSGRSLASGEFRTVPESQVERQILTAANLIGKHVVDREGQAVGRVKNIGLAPEMGAGSRREGRNAGMGTDTRAGGMTGRAGSGGESAALGEQIELYVEIASGTTLPPGQLAAIPASRVRFNPQAQELQLQVGRADLMSQLSQGGGSEQAQSQRAQSQQQQTQAGQPTGRQSADQARQGDATRSETGPDIVGVAVVEQYALRPVDTESMIPLAQLPEAVRRGVEREAPGREIADIDRELSNGRVVYEVEFRDSGVNPRLHFNEDGTLVQGEATAMDRVANFFAGTQISDTPSAVQDAIRREARDGRVTDVDVERRTGRRVYEVEVEDSRGRYEIHFDDNGTVLRHDRRAP